MRSWLRLPEDTAAVEAVLSELLPWMESIYLRYSTAREALPPCWLWHPEIVEELLWLMDAWTAAYEGAEASNKLVGDWHDRQRPGVTRRVGEYAPSCDVLQHRDDADSARSRAARGRGRPVRDVVGHRPRQQRPRADTRADQGRPPRRPGRRTRHRWRPAMNSTLSTHLIDLPDLRADQVTGP